MKVKVKLGTVLLAIIAILLGTYGQANVYAGTNTLANPIYDESTRTTDWSYVYFGSYPQTEVTGVELVYTITDAKYNDIGDAIVDGVKYRRIVAINPDTKKEEYRYFRYDPIKWKILKTDGHYLTLLANQALEYREDFALSATTKYSKSALCAFLNGYKESSNKDKKGYLTNGTSFISTAFTSKEQELLEQVYQKDLVTIPTEQELYDSQYGFSPQSAGWETRVTVSTPYSTYFKNLLHGLDVKNLLVSSEWFYCVASDDTLHTCRLDNIVSGELGAIVPKIKINMNSKLWSVHDPVTYKMEQISLKKAEIKLAKKTYTYTGEEVLPNVTVKHAGIKLTPGVDYEVEYENNIYGGTGTIIVKGTGNYKGSKKITFKIGKTKQVISGKKNFVAAYSEGKFKLYSTLDIGDGKLSYKSKNKKIATVNQYGVVEPKGYGKTTIEITASETMSFDKTTKKVTVTIKPSKVNLESAKSESKGTIKVKWKTDKKASGYEVTYTLDGKKKSTIVKQNKNNSVTLKGLKRGRSYQVKVRAYTIISGKKVYGAYSKVKKVMVA